MNSPAHGHETDGRNMNLI